MAGEFDLYHSTKLLYLARARAAVYGLRPAAPASKPAPGVKRFSATPRHILIIVLLVLLAVAAAQLELALDCALAMLKTEMQLLSC